MQEEKIEIMEEYRPKQETKLSEALIERQIDNLDIKIYGFGLIMGFLMFLVGLM